MARRMLHGKISISTQVNKLPLPARLLFTWMIAHADDYGRLQGEPEYIKATVVPMTKWSFKRIKQYLENIKDLGLIYYWEINNEWFVEFVKWVEHQTIRDDRRKSSQLPTFSTQRDNRSATKEQPDDNQESAQANISESNEIEVNKSEYTEEDNEGIADKNSYKGESSGLKSFGSIVSNPETYPVSSEGEVAARDVWKSLEPENPQAFFTTYLPAVKQGVPASIIYQFKSEIEQDQNIRNKGAVFVTKIKEYLRGRKR